MSKRETLAYILIGIILFAWVYYTTPQQEDISKNKKEKNKQEQIKTIEPKNEVLNQTQIKPSLSTNTNLLQAKTISLENKVIRLEFTTTGGNLKKVFLKNYTNWYYNKKDKTARYYQKEVQLINHKNVGDFYIKFYDKSGNAVNTSYFNFNLINFNTNNKTTEVIFELPFSSGAKIIKRYFIKNDNYDIKANVEFINFDKIASIDKGYSVIWNNGIRFVEEYSHDEARYADCGVYQGGEHVVYNVDNSHPYLEHLIRGKIDWANIRNKYFTFVFIPLKQLEDDELKIKGWHKFIKGAENEIYSFEYKTLYKGKNNVYQDEFNLYLGPIDYDILKSYNKNLQQIVDFGNLFGIKFIIRPISEYLFLPLLKLLHYVIPNYGFVIIIFALLVKLLLFPISKITLLSQKKMSLLQPEIEKIRKNVEDPTKQQQEIMKLYSHYGINPMGGCFPLLLQMPILVALWSLFNVAIDLRNQPFALWITNLSVPDVVYTLPFKIPLFGVDQISALALLLGLTMFLQQKNQITDPSQKAMVYMMPIMMTMLFMGFPAGLNLYYFVFNIFSILEQKLYFKLVGDIKLEPVKVKKKSWMQKMMEETEKRQKMTQQMRNQRKK